MAIKIAIIVNRGEIKKLFINKRKISKFEIPSDKLDEEPILAKKPKRKIFSDEDIQKFLRTINKIKGRKMPTKELKLADLVNDAGICWDYSYDKDSGTLELSLDLDTVANRPTNATVTWVQNEDGEGLATVSIEEEDEWGNLDN